MPTVYGQPNCVGWYVAERGVYRDAGVTAAANGDGVAQWNDLSGAGNHLTQATAGGRPVLSTYAASSTASGPTTLSPYGDPIVVDQPSFGRSVLFDGAASYLNIPATLAVPSTGCTVVMCSRGPGQSPISFGTDGVRTMSYGWVGGAPQAMGVYTPAAGVVPFPAATHLPTLTSIVHGFRCSASLAETRVYVGTNQQSALPVNYGNAALTGGAVGLTLATSYGSHGNFGFAGELMELLIFSSPLTDAAMATLLPTVQTANRLRADANAAQVVFVGDDLTAGGPGAQPVGRCYPWHLCQQFGGSFKPLLIATPGQTVAQQQSLAMAQVLPLDQTPFATNVAVVCAGSTDLAAGGSASTIAAGLATLCGSLRSGGYQVVVATIPARSAATASQQVTLSTAITAVNNAIRSGHATYADAMVDWAADPRLSNYADAAYFADGVHTSDAGDGVKAELVRAALEPLLTPPAVASLSFASFYSAGRTFAGRFGNFPRA